jgi:hypothetical protein
MLGAKSVPDLDICRDYVKTGTSNIQHFLRDKSKVMAFTVEDAERDFPVFYSGIGAVGDIAAAMRSWQTRYNESRSDLLDTRLPDLATTVSPLWAPRRSLKAGRLMTTASFAYSIDLPRSERSERSELLSIFP